MGSRVEADARRAEAALGAQLAAGEGSALPALVGRLYRVTIASGHTVGDFEIAHQDLVTIEQVQRDGQALPLAPDLALQRDDIVLVIGRRQAMVPAGAALGEEVAEHAGMGVVMQSRRMVFTHPRLNNKTVASIIGSVTREVRHGVYLERIERNGEIIPALPALKLQHGDILTLYGTPADTRRAVGIGGYELVPSEKTDFIYFGSGVLLGLLIGLATSRAALAPFSLGASGGALLSGLLFGWARSRHPMYGAMPSAASRLLRDFGLASFAAVIGLNASLHAAATLREQWPAILALGTLTALVPMLLAMLFGRYVLRYDNAALLAGALAGARTANPAFRTVLEHAGSHAPAVPYASAYALATVLLTLVGTLIVGLA